MLTIPIPSLKTEKHQGSLRVIFVQQRHERSGRVVTLLDAEGMGERKATLRKQGFTYRIEGVTALNVQQGSWLLSPREDLGLILETRTLGSWMTSVTQKRVALRVQLNDPGLIRLNEEWLIFSRRPITQRMLKSWEKRMTDSAQQYFRDVLPSVIDTVLHEASPTINGDRIRTIRAFQEGILRQAIRLAEMQQLIQLTSNHLVRATREILEKVDTH